VHPDPEQDPDDFEDALRLEVSGTDKGDDGEIRRRVNKKVDQLRDGNSSLPGLAAVVGFRAARVSMQAVETED